MILNTFFRGIVIGILTGMPLGPIGALCLRTTLANGPLFGLVSGLGSCVADSLYASVAALGLTFISRFLTRNQHDFRLFGGIILILFGIHIFLSKKENKEEIATSKTLIKSFLTTFFVALANPATVLSFLFVFAGYGIKNLGHSLSSRIILVVGVFFGSLLWWILLILIAGRFHHKLRGNKMTTVNKVIGSIVVVSGLFMILSLTNYKRLIRPPVVHTKLFEVFLHLKPHNPFRK